MMVAMTPNRHLLPSTCDVIGSLCELLFNLYFTLYGASELRMRGAIANLDDMIWYDMMMSSWSMDHPHLFIIASVLVCILVKFNGCLLYIYS